MISLRAVFRSLFLALLLTPIKAEIVEKDIKGLYAMLKPQYGYLSPIYGLAIHRNGILPNTRFHGNFGPENLKYKCHPQLNQQQRQLDCPQDDMAVLIQQLFPAPGGGQLVPNNYDSLIKNLKPRTIGVILRHITQNDMAIPKLTLAMFKHQDPQSFGQLASEILSAANAENKKARKSMQINSPEQIRIGEISRQITALRKGAKTSETEDTIKSLSAEKERLQQTLAQAKQGPLEQRQLTAEEQNELYDKFSKTKDFQQYKTLAINIANALQVQKNFPNDYPLFLVEHSLLAFAVKKDTTTKNDFLDFFDALGIEFLNPEFLENGKIIPPENWTSQYTPEDYSLFKKGFEDNKPTPEMLRNTLQNPEDMLYYTLAYDIYDQTFPRTLDFSKAIFPAPKPDEGLTPEQLEARKYPDCGEMSLRNFFNVMLYDATEKAFNVDVLTKMAPNADPRLFAFFQRQRPDNLEEMRHEWSDIVSNIKRYEGQLPIKYSKKRLEGQCDITPSLINLLRVAVHLLNDEKLTEIEISNKKDTQKSVEILNRLGEMISNARENFKVTWQVQNQNGGQNINNDTDVVIEFKVNYTPEFMWSFTSGHFDFRRLPSGSQKDWRKSTGQYFYTQFTNIEEKASQLAYGANLLPFYTTPDTAKVLLNTLQIPVQRHLYSPILFSFPMDTGGSIKAIDLVLTYQKNSIQQPGPLLETALSSWIPKLPNDPEAIGPLCDVLVPLRNVLPNHLIDFLWNNIKIKLDTYIVEASNRGWVNVMALIHQQDPNSILRAFESERRNTTFHYSPLFLAILANHKDVVEFLLDQAPQLLEEELVWGKPLKLTPLHAAVRKDVDMVNILLDKAPKLLEEQYVADRYGDTPLRIAVSENKKEIVKLLLEKVPPQFKNNLFLPNKMKQGALHGAGKKDIEISELILSEVPPHLKARLFEPDQLGNTPLLPQYNGDAPTREFVDLILREVPPESRPSLFLPNTNGDTALSAAIAARNFTIIPLLVKESPAELVESIFLKRHYSNNTPLHISVRENNIEFAQILLQQAPNLAYEKNDSGYTPLHIAAWNGDAQMMELLLETSPKLFEDDYVSDLTGKTPLHWAAEGNKKEAVEFILTKIKENPKLKETLFAVDNEGKTPLMLTSDEEIKSLLIESEGGQ